jgi:hypothetical protein
MNVKMPPFSNKKMFSTLQFNVGGVQMGKIHAMFY